MIPTFVHGVLDYVVGFFLIGTPWLFSSAQGGAETWVPVALGAGVIVYSLFTRGSVRERATAPAGPWRDHEGST